MPASAHRRKPSVPAAPPKVTADFSPLLTERHVALAVSGGSDSTALMNLACNWARTNHPGLVISVLTVDHGLRPEAADEAAQVAGWAAALNLPHHILRWEDEPKPATGLQAKARGARYSLMAQWCREQAATALLTGHTLDDQAETVLMRLSRTISPESLAGVRPRGAWEGLPLVRPLLGARRQALRGYLETLGQRWIDDPSNADLRFERVRVRQALAVTGSGAITPERLATLAIKSARAADLLERTASRWIELWLREEEAGICHLPSEGFVGLPGALGERIVAKVVARYGGGQGKAEPAELRRLWSWACSGEGPVRCTLAGALLGRRKTGVWVTREAARIKAQPDVVPESGKLLWDNRFLVEALPGSEVSSAAGRKAPGLHAVPVFARMAYPWVDQPAGGAPPPRVRFLRITAG